MKLLVDVIKTFPFTMVLLIIYLSFICWVSDWVHKCIDNNLIECANSSGWLESFNVIMMISILPLILLLVITLILDNKFGKE